MKHLFSVITLALFLSWSLPEASGQAGPALGSVSILTNREVRLSLSGTKAANLRIDATTNLASWTPIVALTNSNGNLEHVDSSAPWIGTRFYRTAELTGSVLTGDYLATSAGDLLIHPIFHASMIITWKDLTICIDPTTDPRLNGMPKADLVLVTHEHSDHYDPAAISSIARTNATLLVSKSVYSQLPVKLKPMASLTTNGASFEFQGIAIQAIPAYNGNHPKGNGNGYLLKLGGRTLYISGDTDDIPEMRALRDIDVAFVCMDGQFNMGMAKAASAVREFQPRVVFPYHYNSQNPATFKQLVGTDFPIEVRLRKWQ